MKNILKLIKILMLTFIMTITMGAFSGQAFAKTEDSNQYNFRVMRFLGKPNNFDTLEDIPKKVTMTKRESGNYWKAIENIRIWGYYNEGEKIIPVQLEEDNNVVTNDKYYGKDIIEQRGPTLYIYAPGKAKITFKPKDEEMAKKLGKVTYEIEAIDPDESNKPSKPFSIEVDEPSSIKAGQDVNIVATAKCCDEISEKEKNALLIVALYKTEGLSNKMITYAYAEKTIEPGKTVKLGAGFNIPEDSKEYKLKIFVWDAWPNENAGGKAISDVKEFIVE